MTLTPKLSISLLLIACFGLYFLGMSTFGITDPGEGYYVEAAREMVESGDFITPHLNYQIYFSKPILTFWLMALPYKIFGVSEFSARIAFSLIATLLVFITYRAGRAFSSEFAGLMSALAIATAPLLIAVTRLSPIDIAFTCFVDMAVFAFAMCALLGKKNWWILFHFALALAVLTKGPAGIILFLAGTIVFLVLERPGLEQLKLWFHRLHPVKGALIFWALILPWYVSIDAATGGLFLLVFFFYENFARFAGHTNLGKSSWWYYLPVIGYGLAPWILLLPAVAWSIVKSKLQAMKSAKSAEHAPDNTTESKHQFLFYLLVWASVEFLFFSFSKTKMDTYILPSFAPFAVCIALKLEDWLHAAKINAVPTVALSPLFRLFFKVAGPVGFVLLLGGPVAVFLLVKTAVFSKVVLALAVAALSAGLIMLWKFARAEKFEQAFVAFAFCFAVAGALAQPIAFQIGSQKRWDDLKVLAEHLRNQDVDIAIFNTFKPAVMFYSRNAVDSFFHPHQLEAAPADSRKQMVISSDKVIDRLISHKGLNLKLVDRSGEWAVYEAVGAKLRRNLTLEEVFLKPQAFEMAISGKGDWGPLTVPYAAGDRHWWSRAKKLDQ